MAAVVLGAVTQAGRIPQHHVVQRVAAHVLCQRVIAGSGIGLFFAKQSIDGGRLATARGPGDQHIHFGLAQAIQVAQHHMAVGCRQRRIVKDGFLN